MTLTTSSKVVQSADVVACELAGEMALLHFETGVYYGLDPTGTRIWSLIQAPTSLGEVLEVLLKEYEVDRGSCEWDLLALIQSLAKENLVEIKDDV